MTVEELDPYAVLGVPQQASLDQIKQGYRHKVKVCHPDLGNEPGRADAFKQVTWAYQLLSDASARATYDHSAGIRNEAAPPPETEAPRQEPDEEKTRRLREILLAARAQMDAGKHMDAEDLARLAIREDRRSADAYVLLAEAMTARQGYAEAIGCLNLALQMAPDHGAAREALWILRNRD